jgi:hypothetical protein
MILLLLMIKITSPILQWVPTWIIKMRVSKFLPLWRVFLMVFMDVASLRTQRHTGYNSQDK